MTSTRKFCTYLEPFTLLRILMDFATNSNKGFNPETTNQPSVNGEVHQFLIAEQGVCLDISEVLPKGNSSITPYQVGHFQNKHNQIGKFLAGKEIIDLKLTKYLPGQLVRFYVTENGLKLKPLKEQPLETQEHIINALDKEKTILNTTNQLKEQVAIPKKRATATSAELIEKVATSLTQKAAETGLPMCLGVFIPRDNPQEIRPNQ